jgi:hypothetical protein
MTEFHPANEKDTKLSEPRIILGSFPTSRFTRKSEAEPIGKGRSAHFYGGERNQFWGWLAAFLDEPGIKSDAGYRDEVLKRLGVGLTDMIWSCDRKGQSALDSDLTNRCYNHDFFSYPEIGSKLKILCTSKGVMNDMLLSNGFFTAHPGYHGNHVATMTFQEAFLQQIGGKIPAAPLVRVLEADSHGVIECLALPSPGSPFRSLKNFGYTEGDAVQYLENYLLQAFRWFFE